MSRKRHANLALMCSGFIETSGQEELLADHPELRKPVIHGLLREGETANLIAPSKVGKSWLVTDLALSVATGRPWLETFPVEPGPVLILDNELHQETSANRIPRVAAARNIPLHEISDCVFVDNLRGRLKDIFSLQSYFQRLQPGYFRIIVLDAMYRFMPRDTDENSNGAISNQPAKFSTQPISNPPD